VSGRNGAPSGTAISRRAFLVGAGATGLMLGLSRLRACEGVPRTPTGPAGPRERISAIAFDDYTDLYRQQWTWDRVAKAPTT